MNRRTFFAAALAPVVVPLPFLLPVRPAFVLIPEIITWETLKVLQNSLKFTSTVSRNYSGQFIGKIGDTLEIRKPVRYV